MLTLQLTSLSFLLIVIYSYLKGQFVMTLLLSYLTLTSIIYHSIPSMFTLFIDLFGVASVITYGLTNLVYVPLTHFIGSIFTFISVILVYGFSKKLEWDGNKILSEKYHAILHLIGIFGLFIFIRGYDIYSSVKIYNKN